MPPVFHCGNLRDRGERAQKNGGRFRRDGHRKLPCCKITDAIPRCCPIAKNCLQLPLLSGLFSGGIHTESVFASVLEWKCGSFSTEGRTDGTHILFSHGCTHVRTPYYSGVGYRMYRLSQSRYSTTSIRIDETDSTLSFLLPTANRESAGTNTNSL